MNIGSGYGNRGEVGNKLHSSPDNIGCKCVLIRGGITADIFQLFPDAQHFNETFGSCGDLA